MAARGRSYPRDIWLFLAYIALSGIAVGAYSLLFALYLVRLGYSETFVGAMSTVQVLAIAAGAVVAGPAVIRFGPWAVAVAGLAAYLVAVILSLMSGDAGWLLLLSTCSGIGIALVYSSYLSFAVEVAPGGNDGWLVPAALGLEAVAVMVGSLLAGALPAVLAVIAGLDPGGVASLRWSIGIGAGLSALAFIPLAFASRQLKGTRPVAAEEQAGRQLDVERSIPAGVFIATALVVGIASGAVVPFFGVFLVSVGASTGQLGMSAAVAWLLAAAAGFLAPAVARVGGERWSYVVGRLAPVPVFLLLAFTPMLPLAIAGQLIRQPAAMLCWTLESMQINASMPARLRHRLFGYRNAAWHLGYAAASLLAGWLIVRGGYTLPFVIFAAGMALSATIYGVLAGPGWRSRAAAWPAVAMPPPAQVAAIASPAAVTDGIAFGSSVDQGTERSPATTQGETA